MVRVVTAGRWRSHRRTGEPRQLYHELHDWQEPDAPADELFGQQSSWARHGAAGPPTTMPSLERVNAQPAVRRVVWSCCPSCLAAEHTRFAVRVLD